MADSEKPILRPRHVAIIMDGNGRWAEHQGKPRHAGHRAGVKSVRTSVEYSVKQGIEVLTLFAFSSENWQRPEKEVSMLMELFMAALKNEVKKLDKNNVRLKIIGDRTAFSNKLQTQIQQAEDKTAGNTISEELISQSLAFADLPEVDLFIRTGGDLRISNFILWQAAYAELYFTPVLWPEFNEEAYQQALDDFAGRQRRFGKTGEQVASEYDQ